MRDPAPPPDTPPLRNRLQAGGVAPFQPAAERASPLDYEHYVARQIRPVAEPVLDLLGCGSRR